VLRGKWFRRRVAYFVCRYFVIANAVAGVYNLAVLLTRRLLLQASLVVHMLDMVSSGFSNLPSVDARRVGKNACH
jgi:hypothetical protein